MDPRLGHAIFTKIRDRYLRERLFKLGLHKEWHSAWITRTAVLADNELFNVRWPGRLVRAKGDLRRDPDAFIVKSKNRERSWTLDAATMLQIAAGFDLVVIPALQELAEIPDGDVHAHRAWWKRIRERLPVDMSQPDLEAWIAMQALSL